MLILHKHSGPHSVSDLSLTINEKLKCLSLLPILMLQSFWWWQCTIRYSPFPPPPGILVLTSTSLETTWHYTSLTKQPNYCEAVSQFSSVVRCSLKKLWFMDTVFLTLHSTINIERIFWKRKAAERNAEKQKTVRGRRLQTQHKRTFIIKNKCIKLKFVFWVTQIPQ